MKKHNIKPAIALAMMILGFIGCATAVIMNAVLVIGKVGWFGAAQLSDFGYMVTIYKESPSTLVLSISIAVGSFLLLKAGAYLAEHP